MCCIRTFLSGSVCSRTVMLCVLTRQVAAQDLHPHPDPSGRPPLRKHSDVLGHDLIEPPHLRGVVVAVPLENLRQRYVDKEYDKRVLFCLRFTTKKEE